MSDCCADKPIEIIPASPKTVITPPQSHASPSELTPKSATSSSPHEMLLEATRELIQREKDNNESHVEMAFPDQRDVGAPCITENECYSNLFNSTLHEFVLNFPEYKTDIINLTPIEVIKKFNDIGGTTINDDTVKDKIKYVFTYFYSNIKRFFGELIGFNINPLTLYDNFTKYKDNKINEHELIESIENDKLKSIIKTKIASIGRALKFLYEDLLKSYDDRTLIYCMRNTCLETLLRMLLKMKQEKGLIINVDLISIKDMFISEKDMKSWINESLSENREVLTRMITFYEFLSLIISDGEDVPNADLRDYKKECSQILYEALNEGILICDNKRELRNIMDKKSLSWLRL